MTEPLNVVIVDLMVLAYALYSTFVLNRQNDMLDNLLKHDKISKCTYDKERNFILWNFLTECFISLVIVVVINI